MSSTPNSLIMGVAAHYSGDMLMPFLQSLRQTSYQGRVCLLVGQMTDEAIAQIRRYADEVIVLDGEYGQQITKYHLNGYANLLAWVRRTPRVRRLYAGLFRATLKLVPQQYRKQLQNDLEQRLEGYQSLRYEQYLKYIEICAPDADYVLLSDVRDVIFQDDPFKHAPTAELEVFLEAEHVTIGNEPFDHRWIRNLYGREVLNSLYEKPVSCSGTTMGTGKGIRRYLTAMQNEIAIQSRPLGSHDQGIHNYLLWNNRFAPVTICPNGQGSVLTMGLEKHITKNSHGRLLNYNGEIAPVIHQYDRHVHLAQELCSRLLERS